MQYDDHLDTAALKRYASAINSRATALGLVARVEVSDLRDLILDSGGCCAWCDANRRNTEFEIDHIISLSAGGDNNRQNLALTCPDCNRRKSGKHPAAFAQETVVRTGVTTPLIRRVLDHYDVEIPGRQRSLFEPKSPAAKPRIESTDEDNPPPYIWTKDS